VQPLDLKVVAGPAIFALGLKCARTGLRELQHFLMWVEISGFVAKLDAFAGQACDGAVQTQAHDPELPPAPPPRPQWMDQAKQMGEAQMQTVKDVGQLIEENPKQAALVVRDWLNQAA
jgi:flagellar biosynthesis/type III secretory pathway M-ring protein FliF/YscJ